MAEYETPTFSIAEFFILRKYRRQGIAKEAAFKVFDMFKGNWSVSWLEKNLPAKTFWTKVILEYSDGICFESIDGGKPSLEFTSCKHLLDDI